MKRNIFKVITHKTLGNQKYQFLSIPVFAIIVSLLACAVLIGLTGKNPFYAYYNLLQGSGIAPKNSYASHKNMLTDFTSYLNYLAPMIFASLAVLVALRVGLFNIGVSGQMLAAGFTASVVIGYSTLPGTVAKPLVILVGIVVGGFTGYLIGFLKVRFNINEVVSSIMINYMVQYFVSFLINTYYVDPVSRQSRNVSDQARLTFMNTPIGDLNADLPIGIILALITAGIIYFLLEKTKTGYEIKAVGCSRSAAEYAGIHVGKRLSHTMAISGALGGLAGVTYYLGYYASIQPKVLSNAGFDAIAVSLLGNNHPLGIILSSALITIIGKGSTYMKSTSGVPSEIASVVTGVILLFSACNAYIKYRINRKEENR